MASLTKKITPVLISLAVILIAAPHVCRAAAEDSGCSTALLMTCTVSINDAFQKCSQERNAKQCIDSVLANTQCLKCLCTLIPAVCIDEATETAQQQRQVLSLNRAINKMATCTSVQKFKCQQLIDFVVDKCSSSRTCIDAELAQSECAVCVCQIRQDLCPNQKQQGAPIDFAAASEKGDQVQLFEKILDAIPQDLENKAQVDKAKVGLDQLKKLGSPLLNGGGIFGAYMQQANQGAGSASDAKQEQMIASAMKFMSGVNLDSTRKVSATAERDAAGRDTLQQTIVQSIMSNPDLMVQMLPLMGGQAVDVDALTKALGGQDALQQLANDIQKGVQNNLDSAASAGGDAEQTVPVQCTPDLRNDCEWDVLRALPACVGQDARVCLYNALGQGHKCTACVCTLVPNACN